MAAAIHYLFTPMTKRSTPAEDMPNRLREHRVAAGLSLEKLGEMVGLTRAAVGLHERGERNIKDFHARRYAEALGIHPADLLSATDNPFALDAPLKKLVEDYKSLDAKGRQTVSQLAENLASWGAPPAAEDTGKKRA